MDEPPFPNNGSSFVLGVSLSPCPRRVCATQTHTGIEVQRGQNFLDTTGEAAATWEEDSFQAQADRQASDRQPEQVADRQAEQAADRQAEQAADRQAEQAAPQEVAEGCRTNEGQATAKHAASKSPAAPEHA
jgi:hypothetical protein